MDPWTIIGWILVVGLGFVVLAFVFLLIFGFTLGIAEQIEKAKLRRKSKEII